MSELYIQDVNSKGLIFSTYDNIGNVTTLHVHFVNHKKKKLCHSKFYCD